MYNFGIHGMNGGGGAHGWPPHGRQIHPRSPLLLFLCDTRGVKSICACQLMSENQRVARVQFEHTNVHCAIAQDNLHGNTDM